jgi:predicted dehydrogenase
VKYRVAVIGLGLMGDVQIVGFQRSGAFDVVAACDINLERAREVCGKRGVERVYGDPDELIAKEQVDLLAIATPPVTHRHLSVTGFEKGWHVLCEKPTAMNSAEAEQMLAAQQRSGRIGVIDHELRFNPVRSRMRELIKDGYIGQPRHVHLWSITNGMWEMAKWTWWSTVEAGGGLLGEVASHQVDLLRWMLGDVASARGRIHTFIRERADAEGVVKPVTSDDYATISLTFSNGVLGEIVLSAAGGSNAGRRIEIHGDGGSLALDAEERLWGWRAGATEPEELTVPETELSLIDYPGDYYSPAFLRLVVKLAESMADGSHPDPAATFADGLAIQRVLDAARKGTGQETPVG